MKFVLMSGAIKNAGDFLIAERSKQLLRQVYPSAEIVTKEMRRDLIADLDEVNAASALIIGGGPAVDMHLYPQDLPLVPNLDDIKVPIFTIGLGWWGATDFLEDIYQRFYLDESTIKLFRRLERDGTIACRDWDTVRVLRRFGISDAKMTGCPAWYAEEHGQVHGREVARKLAGKGTGLTIGISDPSKTEWLVVSEKIIDFLKKKYPEAVLRFFFHRGIRQDQNTIKKNALQYEKFSRKLEELNVDYKDISYSADGFSLYDACDLHIGMRVHAHIYNLSIGHPSILFEEDSRGAGANKAFGLSRIWLYPDKGTSHLKRKIYRLGHPHRFIANQFCIEELNDILLNYSVDECYESERAYETIQRHRDVMISHIQNFERWIRKCHEPIRASSIGQELYAFCKKIFPYCRSITGDGVRQTLSALRAVVPEITLHEVPSGTPVFDWTVPKEWRIRDAWIKNAAGEKVLDFHETNLRVLGYSAPLDKEMTLAELKKIIYTQPDQPDAIPYVTSYYKERSGFCMTQREKDALPEGTYHAYIDSEIFNGSLTYGEVVIPSTENCPQGGDEILFSTYDCHPSMANNECSGPAVSVYLAKWLKTLPYRRYTYRFLYIPETIGSITYLSQGDHLAHLKAHVKAGFNLSCVGDDRTYTYVATRYGDTLADRVAQNVLHFHYPQYEKRTFLDRGSDERQYNAPGVDIPVCAICRSKYSEYPEYHTSKDNLDLISPSGLQGAFEVYQKCILALEANKTYRVQCFCEPQLGKRGLYPTVSQKGSSNEAKAMTDFIAYADGTNDLIAISNRIDVPVEKLTAIAQRLVTAGLMWDVTGC